MLKILKIIKNLTTSMNNFSYHLKFMEKIASYLIDRDLNSVYIHGLLSLQKYPQEHFHHERIYLNANLFGKAILIISLYGRGLGWAKYSEGRQDN